MNVATVDFGKRAFLAHRFEVLVEWHLNIAPCSVGGLASCGECGGRFPAPVNALNSVCYVVVPVPKETMMKGIWCHPNIRKWAIPNTNSLWRLFSTRKHNESCQVSSLKVESSKKRLKKSNFQTTPTVPHCPWEKMRKFNSKFSKKKNYPLFTWTKKWAK